MSIKLPDAPAFPAATLTEWRALVERAIRGAPFESLVSRTYDGIAVGPLYAASDRGGRIARNQDNAWRVFARLDHPDLDAAMELARSDLENGADGLQILGAHSPSAFGFGLGELSEQVANAFFERLRTPPARLDLDCAALGDSAAARLLDVWALRGLNFGCAVSAGIDPLGNDLSVEAHWPDLAATIMALRGRGWRGRCFGADARRINATGGSEAQELAYALASAVACMRALERVGISPRESCDLLVFKLAVDTDQFLGVAKLRALRQLWTRVEVACGLNPLPIHIHAETAWRVMTRRAPWTNVMRGAVAGFSAVLGGADAITVMPFTQALGLPDLLARRLARNTQLVLQHESHLDAVADPAAGSGAFEALTDDLCHRAWALFQEIERDGGLRQALASGEFCAKVEAARVERARKAANRTETFVGASDYPDLSERSVETLAPLDLDAIGSRGAAALFPLFRGAEPFERLRDRSDARLDSVGVRPRVFLAALGPAADCSDAIAFVRNLFAAGGVEAIGGDDPMNSGQKAAEDFLASGATLACLCPARSVHMQFAAEISKALAKAGARHIYYAGTPNIGENALASAGVADFLFAGCDALSILESAIEVAA